MRIAYLINCYPAVSHSFIRREILAIEAAGHMIDRISIRRFASDLPDEIDHLEKNKTFFVLEQGVAALLKATCLQLLFSPTRWLSSLRLALDMKSPGIASLARHMAYLAEACLLVRRFTKAPVDHLHAHFGTNPAAVARLVRQLGGPTYSFTAHGPDEFDAPREFALAGKIEDALAVVGVSDFGRSQLMRWSDPANWHKISVVRCGVDERFLTVPADAVLTGQPHLCSVARLSAQKGLPLLIEAADMLRRGGIDFRLTIVGDGELRPQIEHQIERQGLNDCIFLAGNCNSKEVRDNLLNARALVLPSFAEGLPVVLMEAMALGRPVVATAVAGIPELVDSTCGWLIPPGSVQALCHAMAEALTARPEDLTRMGANGRERVMQYHDATRNALAFISGIEQASCRHGGYK